MDDLGDESIDGFFVCVERTNDKKFLTGFGVMHGILHPTRCHVRKATKTPSIQRCFCVYSAWYHSRYSWQVAISLSKERKNGIIVCSVFIFV